MSCQKEYSQSLSFLVIHIKLIIKKNIRYSSLDHSKNCAPNWAVIIKDTQTIANQHNNISNNNIGNNNNKKIRKRLKFLCGNEKWYLLRAG